MNQSLPTIIVIGYSRPDSLTRLLGSLRSAQYPQGNVRLIISLDNSGMLEPLQVASAFEWPHGDKRIIAHQTRLGLRNHVLSCGDLSEEYGDILVLEDDLFVSPFFYQFTYEALRFYAEDEAIAGISLYSQQFNQTANLPFMPVDNGDADAYFMQLAASWGQAWSRQQWQAFRQWLEEHGTDISAVPDIPPDIRGWPESSWLKLHNAYIIARNKFFVYPYRSLSTNFGDPGQHFNIASSRFQVPLQQLNMTYHFKPLASSLAVYDAFCEILPKSIKQQNPLLADYDFSVNLYGCKQHANGLQLARTNARGLHNFSLSMKPMELSVMHNVQGEGIGLIPPQVAGDYASSAEAEYGMYRFFYKFPSPRIIFSGLVERLQLMVNRSGSR
ncbi:glycosyltransferase family 2 protein [Halopseudomonas pelagia]|uniref:glycosyltransferase family 2 protein n=1 Tax=Halopseudomonas pelagia TaxID=553151 RepID=UPI0003A1698D|nr:glycosyltransferase family 2 protein [Halopseudomonas pelagia]